MPSGNARLGCIGAAFLKMTPMFIMTVPGTVCRGNFDIDLMVYCLFLGPFLTHTQPHATPHALDSYIVPMIVVR